MAKETQPGRPSKYTSELGIEICRRIAEGESLNRVCKDEKFPNKSTVLRWLLDGKHSEFCDQYRDARELQAESFADEIHDIADDGTNDYMERLDSNGETYYALNGENIQRSRLRIHARQWTAERLRPKVYGARTEVEHTGTVEHKHVSEEMDFAAIRKQREERKELH